MNVRDLEITLRPRKGWEAVDLGFMVTRTYYKDLLKLGFTALLPFCVVIALLCWKVSWLTVLLIWLFKPIYDRFYLYYFSRRIFGQQVSTKDVLKQAPRFFFKQSLPLITLLRLAPARSMMLPIRDLEQQSGNSYRKRVNVVRRTGGESALMTTTVMHLCEVLFVLGISGFIATLIPQGQFQSLDEFFQFFLASQSAESWANSIYALVYGLIIIILEPFYVGAGFSLYLNSRCSQEAWDIELRFKEFANRLNKTLLKPTSTALLTLFTLLSFGSLSPVKAEAPNPQTTIEQVYQQEEFKNSYQNRKTLYPKPKRQRTISRTV